MLCSLQSLSFTERREMDGKKRMEKTLHRQPDKLKRKMSEDEPQEERRKRRRRGAEQSLKSRGTKHGKLYTDMYTSH